MFKVVTPKDDIPPLLAELDPRGRRLFVAGCVERIAPFFVKGQTAGRAQEVDTYLSAKNLLWALHDPSAEELAQLLTQVEEFAEITKDDEEGEAEGAEGYAEDAVIALYYALKFVTDPHGQWGVYCAERTFDSAYFLDETNGRTTSFHEEEHSRQRGDIAQLLTADPDAIEQMRTESASIGQSRYDHCPPMPASSAGLG